MFFRFLMFLAVLGMFIPQEALAGHRRPGHHPHPQCSSAQIRSNHCQPVRPGVRVVVSPSHLVAERAILAPAPPVRDMSGYRTTTFVAPAGTPYPLTEPQPGDYLCTTLEVPLDSKVMGMHGEKPLAPCGYKWRFDAGKGKGYWWLAPDPAYGVRAR